MRRGFGLLGLVLTVIVLVGIGAIAYNIGWSQGVGTHLPEGATAPPPGYYYGYGFHPFGFFGILWFLLILFGLFWLFRLAFWGFAGRRMMGGGWKGGRGWGYYGGPGSFEERAREWHRKEHGEEPPSGGSPPPPPDTRSV
jgi:hypothetical protein